MYHEPSVAHQFYEETGDARWLDRDYARRMSGPMMAAKFRARRKAEDRAAELAVRRSDKIFVYLKSLCVTSRKNATKKGMAFTITDDWLWETYRETNGKCALTGIPFSIDRMGFSRAPFAPSLDRINCSFGYEPGNVRIACQMANLAMNVWGEDVLHDFIRRAHANL